TPIAAFSGPDCRLRAHYAQVFERCKRGQKADIRSSRAIAATWRFNELAFHCIQGSFEIFSHAPAAQVQFIALQHIGPVSLGGRDATCRGWHALQIPATDEAKGRTCRAHPNSLDFLHIKFFEWAAHIAGRACSGGAGHSSGVCQRIGGGIRRTWIARFSALVQARRSHLPRVMLHRNTQKTGWRIRTTGV
ncbi:MAG: hypothetical protein KGQ94_13020, partial [Alphaproteobacteria bacterium]|nr:hypothetical protein [Alphaproteobacteria bacterium]